MTSYSWATDTHLDHLGNDQQKLIAFAQSLIAGNPAGIFLTGDISVAKNLVYHLQVIEKVVQRPIFFVLGNHDAWGADIATLNNGMKELTNSSQFLRYMPTMPYYALSPSTAVVGHGCWYDAQYGDWQNSSMAMVDWSAIHDFIPVKGNKASIVGLARKLALEGVQHVHNGIKQAARLHKRIIVLTHYPPYPQAHLYQGKIGEPHAMPWYTCKYLGDVLTDASKAFPNVQFTVLAGHTHGKCDLQIAPNLTVHVGGAEYGAPLPQGMIEIL